MGRGICFGLVEHGQMGRLGAEKIYTSCTRCLPKPVEVPVMRKILGIVAGLWKYEEEPVIIEGYVTDGTVERLSLAIHLYDVADMGSISITLIYNPKLLS